MSSSSDSIDGDHGTALARPSDQVEALTRRSFLGVLLGFGSVVVGTALSVPVIRFALHPLLTKTTEIGWADVGNIDEFASLTAPVLRLHRSADLEQAASAITDASNQLFDRFTFKPS